MLCLSLDISNDIFIHWKDFIFTIFLILQSEERMFVKLLIFKRLWIECQWHTRKCDTRLWHVFLLTKRKICGFALLRKIKDSILLLIRDKGITTFNVTPTHALNLNLHTILQCFFFSILPTQVLKSVSLLFNVLRFRWIIRVM